MPEAIIVAIAEVIKEVTALIRAVMEGQTPEQRKILWDWYIQDVGWWRNLLKIGEAPK